MEPVVLMLSPFLQAQRGNSITVNRISQGLSKRGWGIELFSTEGAELTTPELVYPEPSIKMIHGFNAAYTGMILQQAPALCEYPLVLTMTGTDLTPENLRDNDHVRRALINCDAAVVFHQDFIPPLSRALPPSFKNIRCIPQGIALPPLLPAAEIPTKPAGEVRLLLPSGLRAIKDIMMTLKAFAQLKPRCPQLTLYIAGCAIDPEYSRAVQARMAELNGAWYLGEIPFAHMPAYYASGDIVINSSAFEGQPQATLEAMSLGLPALLRDAPGNQGVVTPGREGYYFATAEELAGHIAALCDHPDRRREMGAAARRLVARDYPEESEIAAYEELYQELIIA